MNKKQLRILGISVLIILVLNIFLFGFGLIHWKVFWIIIGAGALFVYKVLPKMRKE
ncbi:hypothetical protein HOL21_03625 [Candidatus Woesearchaeota archaeon]|jgi:hypothetical protein|nr:hypothetical protein [Candidatus Woesearchaeota archaeon]MBT5397276.1 hypothetical protein [Candidatus Woesearchaeota archaeon]MBT5924491.1 hypothetical protein [Candidatus Woesearchaeota archaeon]MBT6367178.1 hypothetical protein [Candidatus Woesearchaeota archaeon]MBT7762676.1 hypothetical protein [Candidatus Woesearchaeota archaeon]